MQAYVALSMGEGGSICLASCTNVKLEVCSYFLLKTGPESCIGWFGCVCIRNRLCCFIFETLSWCGCEMCVGMIRVFDKS